MPTPAPQPPRPAGLRPAGLVAGLLLAVQACTALPDTGRDATRLGAVPPLVPMDDLMVSPPPEATAERAAALAARGAALKAQAAALE